MHGGLDAPFLIEGEGRRLLTHTSQPLAVALSGGGDSVALLRLAADWAARNGRPLLALTVDHGLHPDSPAWTDFAAERAQESGAVVRTLKWEGDKPAAGLPAAARAARHALLATAAREAGATVILLGHTADDVSETERMRAGDAAGIGRLREWAPSPAWPEGRGVMLLRPMLGLRRADLRTWLAARGDIWLDDPANEDRRFARVRARQDGDGARREGPSANRDAALAAQADPVEAGPDASLRIPLSALLDRPTALRLLAIAAVCAGGGHRPPRSLQVERALVGLEGGEVAGLCGARLERRGGHVMVSLEPGERRRNPRPNVDGVVDGRFDAHGAPLVLARFRATCFLVEREAEAPLRTSA